MVSIIFQVEAHASMDDVANAEEVKETIITQLQALIDQPKRIETPLIYHVDVAAVSTLPYRSLPFAFVLYVCDCS